MLSSLHPMGVSDRLYHALHPPHDAFIAPPCERITYHTRPLRPQSLVAPQTGRRVVWEGVKRAGGRGGPRPGGRKAILDLPKKCTYGIDFCTPSPHDAVPAVRTQQPCDDSIRCRSIINPRSTHFVSGSASGSRAHSIDPLPASGCVACDGV